jgi:hypothetical protein
MTLIVRPGFQFDTDASTYIEAVEVADTQALETATRYAINDFVIGCKQNGIWNAIKASCILSGARTLTGALVPLVGTAPTNFNFVAGDYNRKTGLIGDGSTKYLNSNRNNNADPQDSHHYSIYASIPPNIPGSFPAAMSSTLYGTTGGTQLYRRQLANDRWEGQSRNSTIQTTTSLTVSGATFVGMSRGNSTTVIIRANKTSGSNSISSQVPGSETTKVFAYGTTPAYNGRIAFYSIGESLDLALLDARVTDLINAFGAAIP